MERIRRYQQVNNFRLSSRANWENFRFAIIDAESTGLDPRRDHLVSLAGIGLLTGEICIWDQFSEVMPVAYNTSSVTVHGITREAAASGGREEPEALADFLDWIVDGVIVGHHIEHDLTLINTACRKHFGFALRNLALDTMETYRAIRERGGFPGKPAPAGFSLDALCEWFHIVPHDRHTASGDAFLTARILLRLLKEAAKIGLWNLEDLHAWYADEPFPFAPEP